MGRLAKIGLDAEGYSVHKLRHTAATLMYQHGEVDVRVLKEILGHESLSTTQIYTHVSNEQASSRGGGQSSGEYTSRAKREEIAFCTDFSFFVRGVRPRIMRFGRSERCNYISRSEQKNDDRFPGKFFSRGKVFSGKSKDRKAAMLCGLCFLQQII